MGKKVVGRILGGGGGFLLKTRDTLNTDFIHEE